MAEPGKPFRDRYARRDVIRLLRAREQRSGDPCLDAEWRAIIDRALGERGVLMPLENSR